jgi:two-component system, sensor histidine kinase
VRLMGLSLQVRSKPGVGSMFRLLVPLGQQMHVKEISQDHPIAQADLAEHYALFVIVIDDEQTVRGATSQLLRSWGCRVLAAGSAEELEAQAPGDTRVPDLIIADLRLRGDATGITEIKTLRTRFGHDIPSVIITGDTIPARLQQVRDSGLEVLHKPLRPDALRQLLSRHQAPQASMPLHPGGYAPHQAPSA